MLPRLRGVLHTLPLPGVGFCVAALAITGVPPFNGFFSKFPLFAAGFALSVEYWILLPAMILLMIESVASFAWFIRWFGRVVPGKPSEAVADAAPLMSQLIDGDLAANNGGWQWAASTGTDAAPYFRIFNPITQGEKFDREGEFIRRWLPELRDVPGKAVHQPWKWAQKAGVKLDYPQPIVDHKEARLRTLAAYVGPL